MIEVFNQMKDNRPFVPLMKAIQSDRFIDNFFVNTLYKKIKSLEILRSLLPHLCPNISQTKVCMMHIIGLF